MLTLKTITLARQIKRKKFRTNEKLVLLSQELFGKPNLGQCVGVDSYKRVEPDEIPNFLLEEWAIM